MEDPCHPSRVGREWLEPRKLLSRVCFWKTQAAEPILGGDPQGQLGQAAATQLCCCNVGDPDKTSQRSSPSSNIFKPDLMMMTQGSCLGFDNKKHHQCIIDLYTWIIISKTSVTSGAPVLIQKFMFLHKHGLILVQPHSMVEVFLLILKLAV